MKKIDFKMLAGVIGFWGVAFLILTGNTGIKGLQPLNEMVGFAMCWAMGFMFLMNIKKDQ
jgi:DMSO/TMAO reductase YedYZ heme-binding membrane subunit